MLPMPKQKESKTEFGRNMIAVRLKRGISQIELAKLISTTQRAISSYETGECYPPLPVITKLAKALKCSADELLGTKSQKQVKEKTDPTATRQWNQFKKVTKLPEKDQRAIMRMVNSLTKN